jgi:endonuclease YncB( thermonuclease family)
MPTRARWSPSGDTTQSLSRQMVADLNELLVSARLARIYGTRTPLPDGRDSRTYLAHLRELETQAKAARRGAWAIETQLSGE